ncbi:MAG: ABC transporter permease [Actinomycetota bacterium]|nr:ABC transporter permease [Actinomycetota bacterium]
MLVYVVRRFLYSIPVLLLCSFIIFTFVSISGDPLSEVKRRPNVSEVTVQQIVERKHLDEPIPVQWAYWLKDATTNSFGTDLLGNRPIWPDLKRVMGNTLQLVIAAELLAFTIALAMGVISAKRQYSLFDYGTTTFSFFGFSMPVFWFALILQVIVTNIYLATDVRIFYTANLNSPNPDNFLLDRIQHLALPVIALSVLSIATYSRYMRASMLEVINSDYVRTARAKGVPERKVTVRHAMRNALIPVVTVAALNFGTVLGGAVVTETVFALDGMGLYFIRQLGERDAYPVMAWLMVAAFFVILFNLLADIVYGYLDPRIRYD